MFNLRSVSLSLVVLSVVLELTTGSDLTNCDASKFGHDAQKNGRILLMNDSNKRDEQRVSYLMTKRMYENVVVRLMKENEGIIVFKLAPAQVHAAIVEDVKSQISLLASRDKKLKQVEQAKAQHQKDCSYVLRIMANCLAVAPGKTLQLEGLGTEGVKALAQAKVCSIMLKENVDEIEKAYDEVRAKYSK